MAGWGIVDERASMHMHADTVVCVRVRACTLVQREMVGLVWVGETAPHCRLSKLMQLKTDIVSQTTCLSFHR